MPVDGDAGSEGGVCHEVLLVSAIHLRLDGQDKGESRLAREKRKEKIKTEGCAQPSIFFIFFTYAVTPASKSCE